MQRFAACCCASCAAVCLHTQALSGRVEEQRCCCTRCACSTTTTMVRQSLSRRAALAMNGVAARAAAGKQTVHARGTRSACVGRGRLFPPHGTGAPMESARGCMFTRTVACIASSPALERRCVPATRRRALQSRRALHSEPATDAGAAGRDYTVVQLQNRRVLRVTYVCLL